MAVVGELLVLIGGNSAALTASLAKAEAQLKGFTATAAGTGAAGSAAFVGLRSAAIGVGVVSVAALGLGVKAAMDFQEQMAIINTIAHQTPVELNRTGDSIRAMAVSSGTPLSDLTSAFYDVLSAGISAKDAINVLGLANTLAIGGLATTKQTVDLLTTAINAYGLDAKGAATATDQFALAVQDGKVTADEIAATFADVAPIARTAGIGIDEISAAYATMTSRGVPAAEVTTQMNRAIVELLKPNADLIALQKETGIQFAEVASQKGLVEALQEMRDAAAANGVPFTDLFGRLEGMKFALSTTGPAFAGYTSELTKMHSATGTAASQAEERMGTFHRQAAILGASLNSLAITIGTVLLPPLTSFVQSLSGVVQSVAAWASANPGLATGILLVGAAIGVAAAAALVLGPALGLLLTPIGLLVTAVGILYLAWVNDWGGMRTAVEQAAPTIRNILDAIYGGLQIFGRAVEIVLLAIRVAWGQTVGAVARAAQGITFAMSLVPGPLQVEAAKATVILQHFAASNEVEMDRIGRDMGELSRQPLKHLPTWTLGIDGYHQAITRAVPATGAAAAKLRGAVTTNLDGGWATESGAQTVRNFIAGMTSYTASVRQTSINVGEAAAYGMRLLSPAKGGPLSEPANLWGLKLVQMFQGGMVSGLGGLIATSISVGAAIIKGIHDGIGHVAGAIGAWLFGGSVPALPAAPPIASGGFVPTVQLDPSQVIDRRTVTADAISGFHPQTFAHGGVVRGSGAQLAIVHGGETVTPAGQSGGAITLVNHTHVSLDGREIMDFVEQQLFRNAGTSSSGFQANNPVTSA